MPRFQWRVRTSLLLVALSALSLSSIILPVRAARREAAIRQHEFDIQARMYSTIMEEKHKNRELQRRIEQLQQEVERWKRPVPDRLIGCELSIAEARERASLIVLAKYVGCRTLHGGACRVTHSGVELRPTQVLKGVLDARDPITTTFPNWEDYEVPPREGQDYIFFINGSWTLKIMRNTTENLLALQQPAGPASPTGSPPAR